MTPLPIFILIILVIYFVVYISICMSIKLLLESRIIEMEGMLK